MNEEQFLCLLFIKNKGHKITHKTILKSFDETTVVDHLISKGYIEITKYGKISYYYYLTSKGKAICDSITSVLNLI